MIRITVFISLLSLTTTHVLHGASLRNLQTAHYLIHTDLDKELTSDLGNRLDAMYDEYNQRLSLFHTRGPMPRQEVFLFRSQRDYMVFTEGRLQNSGGAFLPGQNQLAAFLGDQGRDQLRRTIQHEAFHQFAYNAIGADLPVWLNEGLAQYFEEGLWNGDGFLLGEAPPRRVRQLQADLKADRLVGFFTLLHMTNDQWARRLAANRADGITQYNQSWAMVHFLVMSKDSHGSYLYRSRLLDMLRLLHDGHPGDEAFQLAFSSSVHEFREGFIEYAQDLKATAEASLIENQGVLADLLVDFSRDGRKFTDISSLRKFVEKGHYRLHYSRGDLAWDTESDMKCYFSDLRGHPFHPAELYLAPRPGAPLPDVVCHCGGRLILRTRFHSAENNSIDHELLIEPVSRSASAAD
jgi:hypothetical protein